MYLDHDNNSAALAEKLFGTGKGVQDFIFLGVSNGIGSGIISNGAVFHNHLGFEPEIGHMSIERNGILCSCGNRGCLEMYASSYVILERLRSATGKNIDYAGFCKMKNCQEVDRIFEEMIGDISVALISSINVMHSELIVLGHDCIDWDEKYVQLLEDIINEKKMVHDLSRVHVRKAFFGKNAQLIGAAANIVNQAFKGEILFASV
jgi:transcriptional regulator of PTS gene